MDTAFPSDIRNLEDALHAIDRDARALVAGLPEAQGTWRADPSSWSVAECLDHLATANRIYLAAMSPPAATALAAGRQRRRPALPGTIGGWFVRMLAPPVTGRRLKAPRTIRPRSSPPLSDAFDAFVASQDQARSFLRNYAHIDLARVRFPNPFITGIRFSLATGLHVIVAHDRRHLWQAWRVRAAAERALGAVAAADSHNASPSGTGNSAFVAGAR